jgi:hypothetical protein
MTVVLSKLAMPTSGVVQRADAAHLILETARIHAGVTMADCSNLGHEAGLDPVLGPVVDDHPAPVIPSAPSPARVQ